MKESSKLYVVRKYIKAINAAQALRKEKQTPAHDVWVDETWKEKQLADAIGFHADTPPEDEE